MEQDQNSSEHKLSRYYAFISYSHGDVKFAKWLHAKLESYRLPSRLSGRLGTLGPIPKRVFPIFRDDDELATSHNLGQQINEALENSRFLIVVCSKQSARSKWVNEEVRFFKALGRDENILCVILDGSPYASDKPGRELEECLPEGIRFYYDGDRLTNRKAPMHFAADFRSKKEHSRTILKLIAALVGIEFDTLAARQRKRTRMRITTAAIVTTVLALTTFGLLRLQAHSLQQQIDIATTESLINQSLNNTENGNTTLAMQQALSINHKLPVKIATKLEAALYGAIANHHTHHKLGNIKNTVTAHAYNKQNDLLAIARQSGDIELWNVQKQILETNYKIHDSRITHLRWLGKHRLFSTARDGSVKIYNTLLSSTLELHGHDGLVLSSQIDNKHKRIFAAGTENKINVWNSVEGTHIRQIDSGKSGTEKSLLSNDNNYLIAVNIRGYIRSWNLDTLEPVYRFNVDHSLVNSSTISPDSKYLATAHANHNAYVWNLASGEKHLTLKAHHSWISDIRFSHDGKYIATASWDSTVNLWSAESGVLLTRFSPHYEPATSVSFSHDDKFLVSTSWDNRIRIWDISKKSLHAVFEVQSDSNLKQAHYNKTDSKIISIGNSAGLHEVFPQRLEFILQQKGFIPDVITRNHDNTLLAASDKTGRIIVWSLVSGKILHDLTEHSTAVTRLRFSKKNNELVSTTADGTWRIWDMASGKTVHINNQHRWGIYALAFNKSGTRFATGGQDRHLYIYDSDSTKLLAEIQFTRDIKQIAFNPVNSDFLVRDGFLHVWRDDSDEPRFRQEKYLVNHAEYDRSGRYIITSSSDRNVRLFDADNGKLIHEAVAHSAIVNRTHFSHNGDRFVSASQDGLAIIWDTASGKILHRLAGHGGNVRKAFFSRDDRIVITIATDNIVRLWNSNTGVLISRYEGHSDIILRSMLNRDGNYLITASRDRTIRVWKLFELDRLKEIAHASLAQQH